MASGEGSRPACWGQTLGLRRLRELQFPLLCSGGSSGGGLAGAVREAWREPAGEVGAAALASSLSSLVPSFSSPLAIFSLF